MLKVIEKNVLTVEEGIICHQTNCQGVFGAGLALQIKNKWPIVFEKYYDYCFHCQDNAEFGIIPEKLLANFQLVDVSDKLKVCNVFGQLGFGRSTCQTDYKALDTAFMRLRRYLGHINSTDQMYFPFKFGCGLAGGDWGVVEPIIEKHFPNAIVCKLP